MALRAWLKNAARIHLTKANGRLCHIGADGSEIPISDFSGNLFVEVPEMTGGDPLSGTIQEHIAHFSIREVFDPVAKRTTGEYQFKESLAILDLRDGKYVLRVLADNVRDLEELYLLIRAGRILPTESWEEPQIKDNSGEDEITLGDEDVVDGGTVSPFLKVDPPCHDFPDHSGNIFGGAEIFPGPRGPQDDRE